MKSATSGHSDVKLQALALDSYLESMLAGIAEEALQSLDSGLEQHSPAAKQKNHPLCSQNEDQEHKVEAASEIKPILYMPAWARNEFQALYFRIANFVLAVPLIELSRTLELTGKNINKIPGQAYWCMGLIEDQTRQIKVVDVNALIENQHHGRSLQHSQLSRQNLLISAQGDFGITCDEVLSIGKLAPDMVRWCARRQSKPWMIGTIIDELTIILDLQQIRMHINV